MSLRKTPFFYILKHACVCYLGQIANPLDEIFFQSYCFTFPGILYFYGKKQKGSCFTLVNRSVSCLLLCNETKIFWKNFKKPWLISEKQNAEIKPSTATSMKSESLFNILCRVRDGRGRYVVVYFVHHHLCCLIYICNPPAWVRFCLFGPVHICRILWNKEMDILPPSEEIFVLHSATPWKEALLNLTVYLSLLKSLELNETHHSVTEGFAECIHA